MCYFSVLSNQKFRATSSNAVHLSACQYNVPVSFYSSRVFFWLKCISTDAFSENNQATCFFSNYPQFEDPQFQLILFENCKATLISTVSPFWVLWHFTLYVVFFLFRTTLMKWCVLQSVNSSLFMFVLMEIGRCSTFQMKLFFLLFLSRLLWQKQF